MAFSKTRELPVDAPNEGRKIFKEMLDEPFVLFVVLGDNQAAQDLVSKAADAAGLDSEPRWVVWARRPQDLAVDIGRLKESTAGFQVRIAAGEAAAFTTSFADEIRDVVLLTEDADEVRVELAYVNAEKH